MRQTIRRLRLLVALFRAVPPVPARNLVSGAVLLAVWPVLSLMAGPGEEGAAFVTAFLVALAFRIALRFDSILSHLLRELSRIETVLTALLIGLGPLALLATLDDPLWCQRAQSAWYIVLGAMFLSDMLAGREDMAGRFWPMAEMRPYLAPLTRAMVLFCLTFLVLNETLIRALPPGGWLVFWALLPVLTHVALSLMILSVVEIWDRRD